MPNLYKVSLISMDIITLNYSASFWSFGFRSKGHNPPTTTGPFPLVGKGVGIGVGQVAAVASLYVWPPVCEVVWDVVLVVAAASASDRSPSWKIKKSIKKD